jgi:hypothetical protein
MNSTAVLPAQQVAKPLPSIEVTAPKDVREVQELSNTLSALSEKVTACVKAGGKPERCQCSYPQDLTNLRKGYETLTKQHPDWKDQLLSYRYLNQEGLNISGRSFFKISVASLKYCGASKAGSQSDPASAVKEPWPASQPRGHCYLIPSRGQ